MAAGDYEREYRRSIDDPEGFWAEQAEALHWERRWDRVLSHDDADGAPRWFTGGIPNARVSFTKNQASRRRSG